jgi:hypothetical protein
MSITSKSFSRFPYKGNGTLIKKRLNGSLSDIPVKIVDFNYLKKKDDFVQPLSESPDGDLRLKAEIKRLLEESGKLQETVKIYDKRISDLKIRNQELEKENQFLELRLKSALKDIKNFKNSQKETKKLTIVINKPENDNINTEYHPNSYIGKHLLDVFKKHGSNIKEFLEEVEKLMEYKDYKLNKSIEHYKNIIGNLKNKLKKNNQYLSKLHISELGSFFLECIENVKKDLFSLKNPGKIPKDQQRKILEMFLLNEKVMKTIYDKLTEYTIEEKDNIKLQDSYIL